MSCRSDGLEVWVYDFSASPAGYTKTTSDFTLPSGAQHVTFGDIDGDGNIDMVFPICDPESCSSSTLGSIGIAYNVQKTLCGLDFADSSSCRSDSHLCTLDDSYTFNLESKNYVVVDLPSGYSFSLASELGTDDLNLVLPITAHLGDYNLDGYPDMMLILKPVRAIMLLRFGRMCHVIMKYAVQKLFRENEGHSARVTCRRKSLQRPMYSQPHFDLNKDGTLDIMLQALGTNLKRSVTVFYNNLQEDAFFFKTIGENGVCPTECEAGTGTRTPDKVCFCNAKLICSAIWS